jgi:hypothetical protein
MRNSKEDGHQPEDFFEEEYGEDGEDKNEEGIPVFRRDRLGGNIRKMRAKVANNNFFASLSERLPLGKRNRIKHTDSRIEHQGAGGKRQKRGRRQRGRYQ